MRILIIGAGDIGYHLTQRLSSQQHDLTLMDKDSRKIHHASEHADALVIEGSGSSYRCLQNASIQNMDIVAAMTDDDEVNLLTCRIAKKVGVPTTIARVRNPEFTDPEFVLSPSELGADHIIHPEKETANAVLQLLRRSSATYAFDFESGKIQVIGVRIDRDSPLINQPLEDLHRYDNRHIQIVAIERSTETIIPKGQDVLLPGDQVFVVCDKNNVSEFMTMAGKAENRASNVIILGGGLVGLTIAEALQDEVNVKLLEKDQHRAEQLADLLPKALILYGNGTDDFDILRDEGLSNMGAFVSVTGDDEHNIISALLARQMNVAQSIALVNKVNYLPVIPSIGIDSVVSKQLLTVNAVEHLIQAEIADIATPPGMEARLIEFIAGNRSKITRKPLKEINFPRNAVVGAVMRGENVMIPHGETHIQPQDRAVVFTLPDCVQAVERLFE